MKQIFIEFTSTKDSDLVAVLKNPTDHDIFFFHDSKLNPTRLGFRVGRAGEPVQGSEGFDNRRRMKFDNTIRKHMFKKVPAGGEIVLEEAFFKPDTDGTYSLQWGPYSYGGLKPGWHVVQLTYNNSESGLVPEAWKGQLRTRGYVLPELGVRSSAPMTLKEVVENSDFIAVATYDHYMSGIEPARDPFEWTHFKWAEVLKGNAPEAILAISRAGAANNLMNRYRSTLSPIRFGQLAQDFDERRPFILFVKKSETGLGLTCPGAWESIDQKAAIQAFLKKLK